MAWTKDLSLNHLELDRQHADLFDLLSAAARTLEVGTAAQVSGAIAAFADGMMAHAAAEEALMEESLYADRGRHRAAHEVFLADLQQLQGELASAGPTPLVGEWLRVRLPEWLRFHIAMNDLPLGAHLARRPTPAARARRGEHRRPS